MALIKSIQKPGTGTRLSYWRPCFWTRYSNRVELLVDGFFDIEARATDLPPDVQLRAVVPVDPEWTLPADTLPGLDYWLLRHARVGSLAGEQAWTDAVDYFDDPWRVDPEQTEEPGPIPEPIE